MYTSVYKLALISNRAFNLVQMNVVHTIVAIVLKRTLHRPYKRKFPQTGLGRLWLDVKTESRWNSGPRTSSSKIDTWLYDTQGVHGYISGFNFDDWR
mmetsp:Transcript_6996/g.11100  ORF Transcript_6996/g.11100 Transcript_6996/m.11100 type:complete len:97 (-) Transcript_6996:71-361(-)